MRLGSVDRILADHADQLDASGSRHSQLGQDQVHRQPMQFGHRRGGGIGRRDFIPPFRDPPCKNSEIGAIWLHDEDAGSLGPRLMEFIVPRRDIHWPEATSEWLMPR